MAAKLTLWYSPGACSLAIHCILLEAGLIFDLAEIDAVKGIPESFHAINPKLKIPVLVIDEETITEVPAIITAIAHLKPDRKFLGGTDREIVRAYEWMNWLSGTLHGRAFSMLFRPQFFVSDENLFEAVRAKGKETIREGFQHIESSLKGDYAVGTNFTAVDAYIYVFYRWGVEQL